MTGRLWGAVSGLTQGLVAIFDYLFVGSQPDEACEARPSPCGHSWKSTDGRELVMAAVAVEYRDGEYVLVTREGVL